MPGAAVGNEVLLAQPARLVEAIILEQREKTLKDISNRENSEWFAVECGPTDKACKEKKNLYWQKKLKALKKVSANEKNKTLLKQLIEAVEVEMQQL